MRRHDGVSIAVVGTGAFATALCRSLAHTLNRSATVHVLGRNPASTEAVCVLGSAHARLAGAPPRFLPAIVPLGSTLDAAASGAVAGSTDADLRALLARLAPDVVVVCASPQPPAESRQDTEWGALLRRAGFGVTLPLQVALAERIGAAYAATHDDPVLVNACFPDAVNPLLHHLGRPALCGLGNIAGLALSLSDRLGITDPARLTMLAHHAHLHRPADPAAEAVAWLDGRPIPDVAQALAPVRALPRDVLNEMSASAGGPLIAAIAQDEPYVGHVPGVCGLPGGYPVTVTGRSVALRLPAGMSERDAKAWNEDAAALDGVLVNDDGTVVFGESVVTALRQWWPEAPGVTPAASIPELRESLLALRRTLRRRAAPPAGRPPPAHPCRFSPVG